MAKKALVIGAGPAGLTAAYELITKGEDIEVVVFEESECFGGISKTVNYKGNRMDMGGHRFFSKIPEVNAWWDAMLPMQGAPAYDDIQLERNVTLEKNGPDPEKEDHVMLKRPRVSRIFFNQKFFDYPISLKLETFVNMGFINTVQVGFSYLFTIIHKRKENSLEDFYVNRFGKKLYSMFFENYTENLSVESIAKRLYISSSTLSHKFKKELRISVYQYITKKRLSAAHDLIRGGETLTNAALKSGFNDYSCFYRLYKKYYT